jgi:hypothetical protein
MCGNRGKRYKPFNSLRLPRQVRCESPCAATENLARIEIYKHLSKLPHTIHNSNTLSPGILTLTLTERVE